MESELTGRQGLLLDHVLDMLDDLLGDRGDATRIALDDCPRKVLDLDSLDTVEFLISAEIRWPPLEILDDRRTETIMYDGTLREIVLWLEELLVATFSPEWMPEDVQ